MAEAACLINTYKLISQIKATKKKFELLIKTINVLETLCICRHDESRIY